MSVVDDMKQICEQTLIVHENRLENLKDIFQQVNDQLKQYEQERQDMSTELMRFLEMSMTERDIGVKQFLEGQEATMKEIDSIWQDMMKKLESLESK